MSYQMELAHEVAADVPAPVEATRRQTRAVRWWLALVALTLVAGGAAITITRTASGAPGIDGVLSQVRSTFGDNGLRSASVDGSTLTVIVAAPDEPSAVRATFEAQMLASAYHDAVGASGRRPIDTVQFQDGSGAAIPGYGPAPVVSDTSIPALRNGACNRAAQAVQRPSLVVRSALTLPYAGGACAFRLRTSDPARFAPSFVVGKLANALGDAKQRSILVEIDDRAGVPQFVDSYTPSGGGVVYIKPGLEIPFGP